jgi:hypothetical protein
MLCLLLQSDIHWCSEIFMKLNISKTGVISFTRTMTMLKYTYRLGIFLYALRSDCIKDLGVHIDCKLHFHKHVHFLFPHAIKLLGLIRTITFSFSVNSLLTLYLAVVRWTLEQASLVWKSIAITDSNLSAFKEKCQPFAKTNIYTTFSISMTM